MKIFGIQKPFKNFFFALLFFCVSVHVQAQTVKGKIVDANTKKAVPFVAVAINKGHQGTTADLDGNFELELPENSTQLVFQMIGYKTKTVLVSELSFEKNNIISLELSGIALSEIVVSPKENPANVVIRKVIENKEKFDINNLPYYLCNTYSKTYFTLSNKLGDENFYTLDTAKFKNIKELTDKHYLLLIESVTEKKYRYKNISQEKIIASKTSGFKQGIFGILASQMQSFTFYDNNISLIGLNYVNPLNKGTFRRYNFEIIDTILNNNDTTLLIKFAPKPNKKFEAMKGILYINKNQYVLSNVLAEPNEIPPSGYGIKIQQLYQKVDSVHWFPKQLNTEILIDIVKADENNDTLKPMLKAVSRQYMEDVKLDSAFKIKHKNIEVVEAENTEKDSVFWNNKRKDTLNTKENETYRIMDSVSKAEHFERRLLVYDALLSGKIPISYIDLDLKSMLRVNDYEGWRLGLGAYSNKKVSRWFSVGGYGAYGFTDKMWKYGGSLRVNFNYRQTIFFLTELARDVTETAGVQFYAQDNALINPDYARNYLISRMDKVDFSRASVNAFVFNFIKFSAYVDVRQINSRYAYINDLSQEMNIFTSNSAGINFKILPKEKFIETRGRLISTGSKFPAFFINVSKGLTNTIADYKGNFDYTKIDVRIDHKINFKVKGFVSYQIQAGKVLDNVPYSLLYNNKGSFNKSYHLDAEKTMQTMLMNQFTSSQYAALFFALNSGQLTKRYKYTKPEIELVHNYIIGSLENKTNFSANVPLADIKQGYSEAGIRLKNILISNISGLGASIFYHYGNYASADMKENVVIKLNLSVVF